MATAENGSHVTWREMNLILGRFSQLERQVGKLVELVGSLVEAQAKAVGAVEARAEVVEESRFRQSLRAYWRPTMLAAGVSALTTLGGHWF